MKKLLLIICLLPALHLFAGDSVSVNEMKFQLMQKQVDAQQQQLEEKKNEIETLMQHHENAMDSKLAIYTAIFLGVLALASWLLNWLGKKEVRDIASEIANKKVDEELKIKLSKEAIDNKIKEVAEPLVNEMIKVASQEIEIIKETVQKKAETVNHELEEARNTIKNINPETPLTKEDKQAVNIVQKKATEEIKAGDSTKAVVDYLYAKALKAFDATDHVIAVNYFNDIIELDPNNIDARFRRAYSQTILEDYEKAKTGYLKVIEMNPDYITAYYNLAIILNNDFFKDYNGAKQYYKKAIDLNPGYGDAHFNLAILLKTDFLKTMIMQN